MKLKHYMNSYKIFGFILLYINGLFGQTSQFCYDGYCYSTDGEPKNVSSLKDAQDYCYKNDSSSWLLEIYSFEQIRKLESDFFTGTSEYLLNIVGIGTDVWTSVLGDPLPSGFTVNETQGRTYLYLKKSGGKLYFYGTDDNFMRALSICSYPGNCTGGYCPRADSLNFYNWFMFEIHCIIASGYGHLSTFEGMTYDEVSNLSVISQLQEDVEYWIGYSKLYYKLMHSNTIANVTLFKSKYPLQTPSSLNESYFVIIYNNEYLKDQPVGNASFTIICMKDNTTIPELTSTTFASDITTTAELTSTSLASETSPTTSFLVVTSQNTSDTSTASELTSTSLASETSTITSILNVTLQSTNVTSTFSESTILLSLLLPILLWLIFSFSFICFIVPLIVKRNTRKESA